MKKKIVKIEESKEIKWVDTGTYKFLTNLRDFCKSVTALFECLSNIDEEIKVLTEYTDLYGYNFHKICKQAQKNINDQSEYPSRQTVQIVDRIVESFGDFSNSLYRIKISINTQKTLKYFFTKSTKFFTKHDKCNELISGFDQYNFDEKYVKNTINEMNKFRREMIYVLTNLKLDTIQGDLIELLINVSPYDMKEEIKRNIDEDLQKEPSYFHVIEDNRRLKNGV